MRPIVMLALCGVLIGETESSFAQPADPEVCRRITAQIFRLEAEQVRLGWRMEANGRATADINQALGLRDVAEGLCIAGELVGGHETACAVLFASYLWLAEPESPPEDAQRWCEQSACDFVAGLEPMAAGWESQLATLGTELDRQRAALEGQIRDLYVALDGRSCSPPDYGRRCGWSQMSAEELPDWYSSGQIREAVQQRCGEYGFGGVFLDRLMAEGCVGTYEEGVSYLWEPLFDFDEQLTFCPLYNACIYDFDESSANWQSPTGGWRVSSNGVVEQILARAQTLHDGCPSLADHIEHYWTN